MTKFLDGYLKSPLSGIAPWILFSVLSTPGRFEIAVCVALALAILTLRISEQRKTGVYALDVLGVLFFLVLAILGLVFNETTVSFLEVWAGELSNIVLAVFVIGTLVARRLLHPGIRQEGNT